MSNLSAKSSEGPQTRIPKGNPETNIGFGMFSVAEGGGKLTDDVANAESSGMKSGVTRDGDVAFDALCEEPAALQNLQIPNPYKHLYEIHDVKDCTKNKKGEIISYTLCQPLVNHYKSAKTMIFKGTNTVMVVSTDCPSNILELLSLNELRRIFTDEELFEIFNSSLQEHIKMNRKTET